MAGSRFPLSVVLGAIDNLSGPLDRVGGKIGAIGKNLTRAGRQLTVGATLPIVGLGTATLVASGRFQESMNAVQAITSATAEDFGALRGQALELGRTTPFSASQVADAMTELATAGFATNEILATTPSVLALASASSEDLAHSAEILAGTLRASHKPASDAAKVADILTNAVAGSAVELADLAEGIKVSNPVLTGMGISLEENVALLGRLGDNMFQGSLAGTALKRSVTALALAEPVAQSTLAKLGIFRDDILDAEGNVKSITGVVDLLERKGATTSDVLAIFGERAGPAMAALVGVGSASIVELEKTVGKSGTAAELAEVRMRGLMGGTRGLTSATEGLMIAIGDSGLLAAVTDVVKGLTGWVQGLAETNPEVLRLAVGALAVTAAVGPALLLIGNGIKLFGLAASGVKLLGTAFGFLAANPIVAAVAGLTALVLVGSHLIENWGAVKKAARETWAFVSDAVGSALGWVWEQLGKLARLVLPTWLENLLGLSGEEGANVASSLKAGGGLPARPAGAPIGAAVPGAASSSSVERNEVRVRFDNLPAGARVEGSNGEEIDPSLGFAMG